MLGFGRRPRSRRISCSGDSSPARSAVDVQWRSDVAIMRPLGELDIATVETLRAALDGVREDRGALVLDLRGLSFMDSTGLHLLVALHRSRAARRFPADARGTRASRQARRFSSCGLDHALPFVAADDAGSAAARANQQQPDDGLRDERHVRAQPPVTLGADHATRPACSSHAIAADR